MHRLARTLALVQGVALMSAAVAAQDPSAFFDSNCSACHTIGGGAQGGPDLKDVTARRSREWVIAFITNPDRMVAAKDPTALALVKQADGMVMPTTPDLTPDMAAALVALIEQRSGKPTAAPTLAPEMATEQDVARGAELFAGTRALANRGPACLSCHDVAGLQRLGGGTFGPDLTRAHARLGGTRGLNGWLAAPPTPMMRATFRPAPLDPAEIRAVTAYLEKAAAGKAEPLPRRRGGALAFLSAPFVVGALLAIGVAGRKRLRGVRRALVASATGGAR